MSKSQIILFVPLVMHGHINFCHGIADVLRNRGHRIIFVIDKTFEGNLVKYGFEEEVIELKDDEPIDNEYWQEFLKKNSNVLKSTPLESVEKILIVAYSILNLTNKKLGDAYQSIIDKIKPNIIIVDMIVGSPTLTNCGIPWVWALPIAPSFHFNSELIPPYWSGLPQNDKTEWNDFIQKRNQLTATVCKDINQVYVSKGLPELPPNRFHPVSPYLNIYLFPKELDYSEMNTIPNNFIGIEAAVRASNEQFLISEKLQSKPGKLVYLSMGSLGSSDLELMTRLVSILSKSPNRFIVSKGLFHDKYELPDNMWGQRMVPQTKVLPLVDLVKHHGGNNTLTETFYFGKPMIIMPLIVDQYDIVQRVTELGFGIRLNPYHCSEQDLLKSVEQILYNKQLYEKMLLIGERIRNSKSLEKAADLIENIVN